MRLIWIRNLPMTSAAPVSKTRSNGEYAFTEQPAWKSAGGEWRQLSGNFREVGYSIEWHDFVAEADLNWSRSFHPEGLEICLNASGSAEVRAGKHTLKLDGVTAGFYGQRRSGLKAVRRGGDRHRFITIELSLPFLESQVSLQANGLHPGLNRLLRHDSRINATVSESFRLSSAQQEMVASLQHPPVNSAGRRMWYQGKALEIAATVLYQPVAGEEFFCQRIKRLNRERAQKVLALLKENLAQPPSLEEIGRRVGCSHFHLSRIFAQEMGQTMTASLRQMRLERAAELLRTGQCNVTEAAFEVGYNSLSHFTVAFRETFGCCPGLYPLIKATQATGC
jgi:AraC-like DNA-binding protein